MATVRVTQGETDRFRISNAINKNADEHDTLASAALTTADFATDEQAASASSTDTVLSPHSGFVLLAANGGGGGDLSQRVADLEARLANMEGYVADSLNTFLSIGNGWEDPYDDDAGIATASSTGYTRTGGYIQPSTSGGSVIAGTTVFSGVKSWSGTNQLRNGVTSTAASAGARLSNVTQIMNSYVGYTFTSASTIDKVIIYGSNDQGFFSSANPNVFFRVRAHTAAPTSTTYDSVGDLLLQSQAVITDTANESAGRTLTNNIILPGPTDRRSTSYNSVWVIIAHNNASAGQINVAEIQAYSPLTVSNMSVQSISLAAAGSITQMGVTLDVETVDSFTINTDLNAFVSSDGGTNYQQLTMAADLSTTMPPNRARYTAGFTTLTGMASALTPRLKITTANNKLLKIHRARVVWK